MSDEAALPAGALPLSQRLTVKILFSFISFLLLAEVRQMEDRLGLTPLAMRKNYWAIDDRPALGVVEVGDADNVHQLYS